MYDIHQSIPKDTLPIKLKCKNNYKFILPVLNKTLLIDKTKNPPLIFLQLKLLRTMFSIFRDYELSLLLHIAGRQIWDNKKFGMLRKTHWNPLIRMANQEYLIHLVKIF